MLKTVILILTAVSLQAAELPVLAHFSFENDAGKKAISDDGPLKISAPMTAQNPDSVVITEPGQVGRALRLSAQDKMRFTIPRSVLNLKEPYTVAFWAKPANAYAGMYVFGDKGESAPHAGMAIRIFFGKLDYRFGIGSKETIVQTAADSAPQNVFQHYAVVNDGDSVTLYVNAEPVKTYRESKTAADPVNRDITIGGFFYQFSYQYEGLLDELYVIGKALTADELLELVCTKQ